MKLKGKKSLESVNAMEYRVRPLLPVSRAPGSGAGSGAAPCLV